MMTLQQLAMDAMLACDEIPMVDASDEDIQEMPKGIERVDNGDGTSTLSISFTLDPKVVAEKARAMAKGVKRDDMSDDLSGASAEEKSDAEEMPYADDVPEDEENVPPDNETKDENPHSPYDGEEIEEADAEGKEGAQEEKKEAPIGDIFSETLDSIDGEAMDARKASRHVQTPIENCRAKDPRFCMYHGQVAWQGAIDKALKDNGITGATAKVEYDSAGARFNMSVTVPNGQASAVAKILDGFMGERGVDQGLPDKQGKSRDWAKPIRKSEGDEESVNFRVFTDMEARLNEMVDDFTLDTPIEDMDIDEYGALMERVDDVDTARQSIEDKKSKKEPVTDQDWDDLKLKIAEAEKQYHKTKAQTEYADIKTPADVTAKSDELAKTFEKSANQYQEISDAATDAKAIFFPPAGRFPPKSGLAKTPWAAQYTKMQTKVGYTAMNHVKSAKDELAVEMAKQQPNIKDERAMIGNYEYQIESFENNFPRLKKAQKQFMQGLYDWAEGINHPSIQQAFPNGRP